MGARAVAIKQADVARAIRAVRAAGLAVMCVTVRSYGVTIEMTPPAPDPIEPWNAAPQDDETEEIVL